MIIKKIRLENIRSYVQEEINLGIGTTLLSGDIGAGKSTILLSIEFALFGIIRGEVSGETLLRHGATQGSVSLVIEIEGREIELKRILKKTNQGISQEVGFIIINDIIEQLSPGELKHRIISLLNYPKEMITKKSLIYRYTVYTPQEEMKSILIGDKESRLDTLRRVFNIDKYKRVKNNAGIFVQEMKIKRREFASFIYDIDEKKELLKERQVSILKLNDDLKQINIEEVKSAIIKHKQILEETKKGIESLKSLKSELDLKKEKLSSLERLFSSNSSQIVALSNEIIQAETEEKALRSLKEVKEERISYEDTVIAFEERYNQLIKEVAGFKVNKEIANELRTKIMSLTQCPTCLQEVNEKHKEHIIEEEAKKISELKTKIEKSLFDEEEIKTVLKNAKQKLEVIRTEEAKINFYILRKEGIEKKKQLLETIKQDQVKIEEEIKHTKEDLVNLSESVKNLEGISKEYEQTKKEFDKLIEVEKQREIAFSTKQKEIEYVTRSVEEINSEIEKKEKIKSKLSKYTEVQDLIENKFIPIVTQIEQSVFVNSHAMFNSLFKSWFNMLIDDEGFEANIDPEFSPLITYKGYDMDYLNLSGGEKTAAALAYRLALNQVINNMMSSVRTRDIIILDEPTDGFSSEQLDKMRDLFKLLNVKQMIIVSHEQKVEMIADNIIRIKKENSVSGLQ